MSLVCFFSVASLLLAGPAHALGRSFQDHSGGFLAPHHHSDAVDMNVGNNVMALPSIYDHLGDQFKRLRIAVLQYQFPVDDPNSITVTTHYNESTPFTWKGYFYELFFSWAIWFSLMVCAYFCCYRYQCPVPQKQENPRAGTEANEALKDIFDKGHFQCMNDSNICICSFFCFGLRWADTVSLAGFIGFWSAVAAISVMAFCNAGSTSVFMGVFTSGLILYFRHQLRAKLGVEAWTLGTCCIDFVYVCCCPCCAIAQEARIVKKGIEDGDVAFPEPEP